MSALYDSDSDSDLELLHLNENNPRQHNFRPRINMGLDDFVLRFRLTRGQFETVLLSIGDQISHPTGKSAAITAEQQLLVTLRFFANGSFYSIVGDAHGLSKASICRCIRRCVTAINGNLCAQYIQWPDNNGLAQSFFNVAGMPAVCGCIDGTHIKLDGPQENEEQYINRHGDHSINAMCVCGPNRKFYYVSARWPGSVNDARVLRNSSLAQRFENGWRPFPNAILLGDSAYPLKEWIIPPILNPNGLAEERFNRAHKSTRRLIENAFGILKERFSCLHGLRVQPDYACQIFKACCILHNICSDEEGFNAPDQVDNEVAVAVQNIDINLQGINRRNALVRHFL